MVILSTSRSDPKIRAFLDDIEAQTAPHPFSHERIWGNAVTLDVSQWSGKAHVGSIQALYPRQGHGERCIAWLVDLADKHGVRMHLSAIPYGKGEWRIPKKRLIDLYKRHGFEIVRGTRDEMERAPAAPTAPVEPHENPTDPLKEFMREFKAGTSKNDEGERLLNIDRKHVVLDAKISDDHISLSFLMVPRRWRGRGLASTALQWFTDLADKYGVSVTLHARPYTGSSLNKAELIAFYKRYGFTGSGSVLHRAPTAPVEPHENPRKTPETERYNVALNKTPVGLKHTYGKDDSVALADMPRAIKDASDYLWDLLCHKARERRFTNPFKKKEIKHFVDICMQAMFHADSVDMKQRTGALYSADLIARWWRPTNGVYSGGCDVGLTLDGRRLSVDLRPHHDKDETKEAPWFAEMEIDAGPWFHAERGPHADGSFDYVFDPDPQGRDADTEVHEGVTPEDLIMNPLLVPDLDKLMQDLDYMVPDVDGETVRVNPFTPICDSVSFEETTRARTNALHGARRQTRCGPRSSPRALSRRA